MKKSYAFIFIFIFTVVGQKLNAQTSVSGGSCYNQTESFFNICTGIDYTFPDGTTQTILGHTEYTSTLQTVVTQCDSVILTILNTTDMDLTTSVSGNVITAHQGNSGYQWVDCDNGFAPISGENNQSYSAPFGNFAVIIYRGNCTDTSACVQIGTVGINNANPADVSVYPNPTTGLFKVKLCSTFSLMNMTIRTVTGQEVQARTFCNASLVDAQIEAAQGIYFMELQSSEGLHAIYKIVKE